jgi:hypothetical protein
MKRVRRHVAVASFAFGIAAAWPSAALAQTAGSAAAEELFKQGRAALEAKDYATACAKLAESNRLERAVGTLISLAQCEEAQDKLASARQHWQEAADFADALHDRLNRGPAAHQRFAELDKRVPRLTVRRSPSAPASLTVKRDDVTLTAASLGSALPVDPGKHVLVVSADRHDSKTFEVTVAEGETREIEVEPGAEIASPPPTPSTLTYDSARPNDAASMRTAGYIVGGAGVVGLGLGVVFGLRAKSKWDSAQSDCKIDACGAGSDARKEKDDAATAGTVSTIAFVVGGAALATGVVLIVLAPSSSTTSATPSSGSLRVVPGLGGISAVGTF